MGGKRNLRCYRGPMAHHNRQWLIPTIVASLALLTTGGWFAQREISCAQKADQAAIYPGAEVRRGATGACRMCRVDGPLYDIAFDYCAEADQRYDGFRIP